MAKKKAFEIYRSFDDWVRAHKHSTTSIQVELEISMAGENGDPVPALKSYIMSLENIRSEIDGEISEANDWIKYFKKKR